MVVLAYQIDFSEEKRKESEEVSEAERIAKEAERKPLWEQLAVKRDEEKAKFDAVRAAMFGEDCLIYYYSTHVHVYTQKRESRSPREQHIV